MSLGLCYLHNHNPPIIHQNLSPDSVQLTAHPVAKISDLVVTKLIKAKRIVTIEKALDIDGFMALKFLQILLSMALPWMYFHLVE